VKELKFESDLVAARDLEEWNPVKELKFEQEPGEAGEALGLWNPVKELKSGID